MEKITVLVNRQEFDLDAVVSLMDTEIKELLYSYHYNSEQEFVDTYAEHHAAKFNENFTVN